MKSEKYDEDGDLIHIEAELSMEESNPERKPPKNVGNRNEEQ